MTTLVDPPVTPYHSIEEIEQWIVDLRAMPQDDSVRAAIVLAESWLANRPAGL